MCPLPWVLWCHTRSMLLVIHAALTWMLVGLILTMQVVHYPLFALVGTNAYVAYQQGHVTRITRLVAPLMLAEGLTGVALLVRLPDGVTRASAWLGLTLLVMIWSSTALIQSPAHGRLSDGFNSAWHARLVTSNWLRTALWLLRGGLVGWWLLSART